MKTIQTIAMLFVMTATVFAQANKFQNAYFSLTEYRNSEMKNTDALLDALAAINETVKNESQSLKSKPWYYKGLISHFVYENETIASQQPNALFEASEAYQKALTVEGTKKPFEGENAKNNLFNLALQMQNEGAKLYNANSFERAYKFFMEVRSVKKFLESISYGNPVDDNDATFNASLCLYKLNKKEEAKGMMQELVDRNYDSPIIYQILSGYFTDEGNNAKGLEILAKGLERYPDNLGLIIDELNIYIKEGRETESIAKLERAATVDPNNSQIYYALGAAYDKIDDKEKAEAAYLKSVALDSENHSAYNNLGALFYNQGIQINKDMMDNPKLTQKQYEEMQTRRNEFYKKSLPYFERANEIKPNDSAILQALKEVYAKLEMYEKSKEIKNQMDKLK